MNKSKVYLNSCELFISSIIIYKELDEDEVHFVWKKGKKFSKSNIYQFQPNEAVTIREKLELGLKLYNVNGKLEAKNSNFIVMVGSPKQNNERQLSSFVLGVHEWTEDGKKLQLQLKDSGKLIGVVSLQVRRKQVMELDNFQKYSAEIEQSSDEESSIVVSNGYQKTAGVQYVQLQKQVEDLKYLNEKLKKDRVFLITRNDAVEKEIIWIKTNVSQELKRMEQYYNKKLAMHASIYQEQIQSLITTFNQNSNTNFIIMKSAINENETLSAELNELRIISQEELEKQQAHYKAKLADAQSQRQTLEDHLEEIELKAEGYQRNIDDLNKKLENTKIQLDNLTLNHEIAKKQFKLKCEDYEKSFETQRKQITDLRNQLSQKNEQLKSSQQREQQLGEELQALQQMIQNYKEARLKLEAQLESEKDIVQSMKLQRQESQHILKKLESDYQFYIAESERNNIKYQKELEEVQVREKSRQIEFDKLLNDQRQRYYDENLKLTEALMNIQNIEKHLIVKDEQIKTLIDDNTRLNQQFLDEHKKTFQSEEMVKDLSDQIEHYKLMHETSEAKVTMLTQELEQSYNKNRMDLELLKDQFEESMKNREKYYEQQIEMLKLKLENSEGTHLKLTSDFRAELDIYKDQIEKLHGDHIKQVNQNAELLTENKNLELQRDQYKHLLEDARQLMLDKDKKYEQSLKLWFSNAQSSEDSAKIPGGGQKKPKLGKVNSLENQIGMYDENSRQSAFRSPNSIPRLKIPQSGRNMSEDEKMLFIKKVEQLGSLDHINYLQSVEKAYQDNEKELEKLELQVEQLKTQNESYKQAKQHSDQQIVSLHDQLKNLQELIEQLKQQLRYYIEKQEYNQQIQQNQQNQQNERIQKLEDSFQKQSSDNMKIEIRQSQPNKLKQQISFRSERSDMGQKSPPSLQQSRERLSMKSKRSRVMSLLNNKDDSVQVQIITLEQITKLEQQLSLMQNQQPPKLSKDGQESNSSKKMRKSQSKELLTNAAMEREISNLQKQNSELFKRIDEAQQSLRIKQATIQRLEQKSRDANEQLAIIKQQLGLRISLRSSKFLEYSQTTKKEEDQLSRIKNTINMKEQQLRSTQQNMEMQKVKYSYQIEQLKSENTKLKKEIKEAEQKGRKSFGFDYTRVMQQDMEDTNKRIIEANRTISQLKMQKETADDELKMIRKKVMDLERNLTTSNERKQAAEDECDVLSRKANKFKRDYEQAQEELTKSKDQCKKIEQQIVSYSSLSSQTLMERKRNLQEKLEMEEQLNKRDAEIRRLNKEAQRNLQKLTQTNEESKDRKIIVSKQIERLEAEEAKHRKLNIQLEQQNELLSTKLTNIEQQNKLKTEDMKQHYREKLNLLMSQISEIKNIVTVSDEQIQQLNADKLSLKQQLDNCMQYISKLENAKQKAQGQWVIINNELQRLAEEYEKTKLELKHYEQDSAHLHNKIANLQQELNKQRQVSVRKSEKMQQYEDLSERYLYEMKNLKVVLSEHESKEQNQQDYQAAILELQGQNKELRDKVVYLNREYQSYKLQYVYTKQQVDELASELKDGYEEVRKKELADTIDEMDQQYQAKNMKREQEILQLYNENAKSKIQIQKKEDENSELLQKYTQIQKYPAKFRQLKSQYDDTRSELAYLKQQQQSNKSKFQKYDISIKELQRIVTDLYHQIGMLNSTINTEKTKSSRLEQELLQAQAGYSFVKEEAKKAELMANQKNEKQKILIQNQEQKILSIELENLRIKEREENLHKQYKQQLHKYEQKLKQLGSTLQAQNYAIEKDYKIKISEKDKLLKEANGTLAAVSVDFKNLESELMSMRNENDQLAAELTNTRLQMGEDQEIYISEINKLKNNIREMEDVYSFNVQELEQQLAETNRQLTAEKLSNRQQMGMTTSRLRESEVERRIEEKLKSKDLRIEELKNTVFVLEQNLANIKRKAEADQEQLSDGNSSEYRILYTNLTQEMNSITKKHEAERDLYQQTQKQSKKQVTRIKQIEQNLRLDYDKQYLELTSLKCELATFKQIYETLQKEVEKRQIKFTESVSLHTTYKRDIQTNISQIKQLQARIIQLESQCQQYSLKVQNKDQQINMLSDRIKQTNAALKIKSPSPDQKRIHQISAQGLAMKQQIQLSTRQNKRLHIEIERLKTEIGNLRREQTESFKQNQKLIKDNGQLSQKINSHEQIVQKYDTINEKSKQNYGVTVDELVLAGYIQEKMFDQEQQLNQLKQDVEELRFNEDRKQLDFEEIKKENFQLNLKMEDYEFVSQQVETLRKICDKLEEEKKIAVFRQEAIKVRLSNLVGRNQTKQNFKDGIQAILNTASNSYI